MSVTTAKDFDLEQTASDRSVVKTVLVAAVLGVVVLYGVAFANSPSVHNAAHDVRHVTNMPCH